MATVGVRELRQRASELLRRVEAGETIEVTDRGRPVALLAPLPESEPLARLRASGDVIPATARLEDLPEPESAALRRYLRGRAPLVSSALARTEVARALLPMGAAAVRRGLDVLRR